MALYKVDKTTGNTSLVSGSNAEAMRHVIQNELGTALADEENLQFSDGLNAVDDSANGKTKVGVNTEFTEAFAMTNIESGDPFSTILGKIKKWFSDLPGLFVYKHGDTMTGALTICRKDSELQANFIGDNTKTTSVASMVSIGNATADGTVGSTYGRLRIMGKGKYRTDIEAPDSTSNRAIKFPNKNGTIALTTDIPTNVSQLTNDSGFITSSGTAANVSGTVAIANGGTGATTRLDAAKNLTNEEVTNPGFVVGLTSNWGKFGWTTVGNLKSALGVPAAANNGTLTIQKNGSTVKTFTANSSSNVTANITVPTKLSELTNDVVGNATLTIQKNGSTVKTFTANASSNVTANITVPTKTSELTNDAKAPSLTCSRKTQDYNSMGLSASEVKFFNMNPSSANRPPEEQWFFLIDMMSDDTSFEGQLALGMTGVNSVYYRRKNGTWQSWTKLN